MNPDAQSKAFQGVLTEVPNVNGSDISGNFAKIRSPMLLVYPLASPDSVWTPHAIADVLALSEEYCGRLVIAASCREFILFRESA